MLPPFIIEQIRKREEEARRREAEQPRLELPLDYVPSPRREPKKNIEDETDRGYIILDLG